MTQLKSLTFAPLPKLTAADPVVQRRNKLIVRLQQQIALVQDPQFTLRREAASRTAKKGTGLVENRSYRGRCPHRALWCQAHRV